MMVERGGWRVRSLRLWLPLGAYMIFTLFPFYWMAVTSLKPNSELYNRKIMPLIVWLGRRPARAAVAIVALTALQVVSKDISYGAYFVIGSYLSKFTLDEKHFSSALTQWLGKISYSLYLWHLPVLLTFVHVGFGRLPLGVLLVGAAFSSCWVITSR